MDKQDIIAIIARVLDKPITKYDRFDELGADELDEFYIKSEIEKEYGIYISEDDVLRLYPTIEDFAEMVVML